MEFSKEALGKKIKVIRKRKGVSQQALAEMANCSPTHISYCETGRRHMSVETLVRIANALHVTADELLIDSLENTVKVSNHEFSAILIDCSEYEKNALLDVLRCGSGPFIFIRSKSNYTAGHMAAPSTRGQESN